MDSDAFRDFLRRGGRSPSAAGRALEYVTQFEEYLSGAGFDLDEADPSHLESFVAAVESHPGESAKLHLWGIRYYYEFIDDPIMMHVAATMRRERVEQSPFRLHQFRGVSGSVTDRLANLGIRSATDLLAAAATRAERTALAGLAAVDLESLEELVRLSDLARIQGLKSIRARLYYDAGIRSVEQLAACDPDVLLHQLRSFVDDAGFDGIAPLPGEVRNAIETAGRLPTVVRW